MTALRPDHALDQAAPPQPADELPDFSQLATLLYGSRYELLSLIGVGGGGSVYRARDIELDELVALKVLRKELLSNPATVERFRNEVRLARRVTHRNVARMFDIGTRQPKNSSVLPSYEGGRMPPLGELNYARRAPTCGHGITMGSRA
jgi:serine/threonine protein kinase